MKKIAIIGSGPTAIYFLNALTKSDDKLNITIFEQSNTIGTGSPYSSSINSEFMLANIGSIEIPPLLETYYEWLLNLSDAELERFSLNKDEITERGFYPRLLLGQYFQSQLMALLETARLNGHIIKIEPNSYVYDVKYDGSEFELIVKSYNFRKIHQSFQHVIMATGHFYDKVEDDNRNLASPWPYKKLNKIENTSVGILGTSLSAIDAFVAIAHNHGVFEENPDGTLTFVSTSDTSDLEIVMMSRKGILPEADFYCPIPYEPLEIFTEELVQNIIDHCRNDLLEETFKLFKKQLAYSDHEYANSIHLETLNMKEFKEAYFSPRIDVDAFIWAEHNLKEAELNYVSKNTVSWRYAILRMHELFGTIVPHLNDDELTCFNSYIKPVFVDDYASVPHESIKRLIAVHKAGHLTVKKLPDEYALDIDIENNYVEITGCKFHHRFAYIINATGNKPLSDTDFPFDSMTKSLNQGVLTEGLKLDDNFRLSIINNEFSEFYCLSIPHILDNFPFMQGLEGSSKLAEKAAEGLFNSTKNL